jgi:hypothetical protein
MRPIQSPSYRPALALSIAMVKANPIRDQNCAAPLSTWLNTFRTHSSVSGTKKGKYCVPKTQLREAGDCRKSANGYCTASNTARNTAPQARERRQRLQVWIFGRSRSSAMAGAMISSVKGGGTKWVTWLCTGPSMSNLWSFYVSRRRYTRIRSAMDRS